ncbi:M48 family metalloprotease, partial [Oceanidesulfovibrio marinus]
AATAGNVFIQKGLILNFDSESEVAGVLAHVLDPGSQRHIAHHVERTQTLYILSLLGALAGMFVGGEAGEGMIMGSQAASASEPRTYSREDATEADRMGMNYLVSAGYPAKGLLDSVKKIQKLYGLGGGNNIPTYLYTHPGIDVRIGYIDHLLHRMNRQTPEKQDNTEFLRVQALLRAEYTDPQSALQ